jgi:hypothetical protein
VRAAGSMDDIKTVLKQGCVNVFLSPTYIVNTNVTTIRTTANDLSLFLH